MRCPRRPQTGVVGDADGGDDRSDSARVLSQRQDDPGDRPGSACLAEHRPQGGAVGDDAVHLRSGEVQPRPKLGRWTAELEELLASNVAKPAREQLTLIRLFEELHGRGYEGGYDAVRRYARQWQTAHGHATATAYVPLSFAPGGGVPVRLEPRERAAARRAGHSKGRASLLRRFRVVGWPRMTVSLSTGAYSGSSLCAAAQ